MSRPVPQCAVDFVKKVESCELHAYQDSGGVWTIGYGHTGPEVGAGLALIPEQATDYLTADLAIAARRLEAKVQAAVIAELTDNQYAALLSFVFNLGTGDWTIWKLLNAKQFDQVPEQMARFVNCGGKKLQGLVNRRNAEIALWSTAEPGSVEETPPSSVTRQVETPPTPAPPKLMAAPSLTTKIATGIAGVGAAASQVESIAQPHTSAAPVLAKLVAACAIVIVICSVIALWIHAQQQKAATK